MATEGQLLDMALLSAIAKADDDAIAALYARYGGAAFGRAYIVVHDAMTAEDVVQESFIKIWQVADTYDAERAGLQRWLMVIVQRRAIDQRRRRRARREASLDAALDVAAPTTDIDAVEQADDAQVVHDAVMHLPAEQRQALTLARWDDMSHGQIASQLGVPLGTVKTRIRLAMRKVGVALREP